MNEKRKGKPKKFTDTLRPWIVVRDTDGNLVIGREVIEGICDSGRTKRCLVIEGLRHKVRSATIRTRLHSANCAELFGIYESESFRNCDKRATVL